MNYMTDNKVTNTDMLSATYRDVLRSLSRDEKRRLVKLTNYHGLLWLFAHFALIGCMAWASFYYTGFFCWLAIVGQGIGLSFLFCAMHECSHGTAFRTAILNKLISSFVGLLLFIGPRWFQYYHAAHHRHTQDPALDPELTISKPKTWGQYLLHLSGIMIWTSNLRALLFNAIRTPKHYFIPSSSQHRIKTEARLMLLTYTFIFTGAVILAPQYILQFWLLPLLLGQPFLRLFLLAEHAGCPHEPDMLKNSRTTRTNPFVLFLSWNMPYHTAHHSFPAVPFHQLPTFHQHIAKYTAVTANGYSTFHRFYAKRFLKEKIPS